MLRMRVGGERYKDKLFRSVESLRAKANSRTKATPLVVLLGVSTGPKQIVCEIEMSPDDARRLAEELICEADKHK